MPPNLAYWTQGQTIPSTQGNANPSIVDSQPHFIRESYHSSLNAYTNIFQDTLCSVSQPSALLGSPVPWNQILESQKKLELLMNNILQRVTTLENASLREHAVSTRSSSAQSTESEKKKPQKIPQSYQLVVFSNYPARKVFSIIIIIYNLFCSDWWLKYIQTYKHLSSCILMNRK